MRRAIVKIRRFPRFMPSVPNSSGSMPHMMPQVVRRLGIILRTFPIVPIGFTNEIRSAASEKRSRQPLSKRLARVGRKREQTIMRCRLLSSLGSFHQPVQLLRVLLAPIPHITLDGHWVVGRDVVPHDIMKGARDPFQFGIGLFDE